MQYYTLFRIIPNKEFYFFNIINFYFLKFFFQFFFNQSNNIYFCRKSFVLIGLISINYRTSPIEVREKFFFQDEEKIEFNKLLIKECSIDGLVVMSTCNRIYR